MPFIVYLVLNHTGQTGFLSFYTCKLSSVSEMCSRLLYRMVNSSTTCHTEGKPEACSTERLRGDPASMESDLSYLSSLKEDDQPLYIQPHYKESYRLAIYALLCGGKEAYLDFLRAEQISHFLSEEEILFILENAESPLVEDDSEGKRLKEGNNPSTYFPIESDEEVPDLELGWPEVSLEGTDTSISLLFHPPRHDTPSIKEVVRKQIQEARQLIAIAMDVFTDVDIFKELIAAAMRGVMIYILLDDSRYSSFLNMSHRLGISIQDLKNVRVRTVQGPEYQCQSGAKFHGDLDQRFILIDCRTALYGTYSYTWAYEKINLSMVLVITGQLVCSYDEEFRRLYARSTVPAVQSEDRLSMPYLRDPVILRSPNSSQLSLNQIHTRSRGMHGLMSGQDDRFSSTPMLTRGLSVQDRLHQYHSSDLGNLVRGHSYGGDLQKFNSMTRLRMGTKDIGGPGAPERTGSNLRGIGDLLASNTLSQQHLRHRTLYGQDQNLIPFNSESSLHRWKMDTYLNDNHAALDASCDALSPVVSPYSSHTGLNELQSQLIHSRSRDIKSRMEEMRQKRLSLQDFSSLRQSQESLRVMYPMEKNNFMSSLRGLDKSVAEDTNGQHFGIQEIPTHRDSKPYKDGILSDGHRSASHYDVKMSSDRKTTQTQDWTEPLSRTTSAGDLDAKLRPQDPSLKLSHMHPSGLSIQHGRAMESLTEIPEEKEGSNPRVNSSDSAFKDRNEETHRDQDGVLREDPVRPNVPSEPPRSHSAVGTVSNTSDSIPTETRTVPKTSTGSQHTVDGRRSHIEEEQQEEPTLQRKNSLRMKVQSLLTPDEKKTSKKEDKPFQRKGSLRSKGLFADHSQPGQSPSMSTFQNSVSGPAETEKHKSPFLRLSTPRSSKKKTNPAVEQDRGSGSTLNEEGVTVQPRQKVYSRFEYLLNVDNIPKDKGSPSNRPDSGYSVQHTSGADKLGRFMQRVGNLISKNK